jgi:hypothetical protein
MLSRKSKSRSPYFTDDSDYNPAQYGTDEYQKIEYAHWDRDDAEYEHIMKRSKRSHNIALRRFNAIINNASEIPPFSKIDENSSPDDIVDHRNEICCFDKLMERYEKARHEGQLKYRRQQDNVYPVKKCKSDEDSIIQTTYEIITD